MKRFVFIFLMLFAASAYGQDVYHQNRGGSGTISHNQSSQTDWEFGAISILTTGSTAGVLNNDASGNVLNTAGGFKGKIISTGGGALGDLFQAGLDGSSVIWFRIGSTGAPLWWNGASYQGYPVLSAPKASPSFTGTVTTPAITETVISGGTCSTSYTPDLTAGTMWTLTLNGACKLNNPTGIAAGKSFTIKLTQSSTTAPTFDTDYKWAAGTAPTWSTSATKYDVISCVSFEGTALQCGGLIDVR
jgi:hypothetical protein